jgi:peroxiredoxin
MTNDKGVIMKKLITTATIALLALTITLAFAKPEHPQLPSPAIGAKAPDFSLKDQDGKTVNLSDYAGKIVVLEWVNPGCPFVQRHYKLNTMSTLANKYKSKDVVWLAINSTNYSSAQENQNWRKQHNLEYPILLDFPGSVGIAYGASNTPHMFIINKDGTLAYKGAIDSQETDHDPIKPDTINYVDKALTELLNGQSVSTPESKPYGCNVKYKD